MRRLALTSFILFGVLSCSSTDDGLREKTQTPVQEPSAAPALWDGQPEGRVWTQSALAALDSHGAPLVAMVPQDIDKYCPGYVTAGREGRAAFWVQLLSALAKHENTWRADAAGGDGQWLGLLQISPATASAYGCRADSATELKDGSMNVSCAIRIMAVTVPRDGVISQDLGGVAADWAPFHVPEKRRDIQATTRAHPRCAP